MPYATVQDLRDEGVPSSYTDGWLNGRIALAQAYVESYTGRFFEPRDLEIRVDGSGSKALFLEIPIISIDSITIDLVPNGGSDLELQISLDDVAIFNRHITQNLTAPDDRENPKIEFLSVYDGELKRVTAISSTLTWPRAKQNVVIAGAFGYTDFDAGNPEGVTPALIRQATILLVLRNLRPKYQAIDDDGVSLGSAGPITEMRTREQTVKRGSGAQRSAIQGAFTGDPEIDSILARYRRPARIGVA